MSLQVTAVGGFNEIGRQSTAIKVNHEVVIVDLGLHLDHYIRFTEDGREDITTTSLRGLQKAGAVPDWNSIKDWRSQVEAIVLTHAHLDHVGAVPHMASLFDCPIYGSPFTIALLKQLLLDKEIKIDNKLIVVRDKMKITDNITLELIPMTHSTPDSRIVALHTPHGVVLVDNDYKVDPHPLLGPPPLADRLAELSGKVILHIGECLYAPHAGKTPSESVARQMLQDVLLEENFKNRVIFVSTFSSHIARLISIIEIGKAMGRQVVLLGRSMAKYIAAAEEAGIMKLPQHVHVIKYGSQIKRFFKNTADLSEYLIVCTGHMGEPKATLSKIVDGRYPYKFRPDDAVILASKAIPVPTIIASRHELERRLRNLRVRIFDDVHVSGHASREDIRWLLTHTNPKHVMPNHGVPDMVKAFVELARELGIPPDRIHNLHEGQRVTLVP